MSIEAAPTAPEAETAERAQLAYLAELATKHEIEPVILTAGPFLRGYHDAERPRQYEFVTRLHILRPPLTESSRANAQPGIGFDETGQLYTFDPGNVTGVITLRSDCSHRGIAPEALDPMWFALTTAAAEENLERNPAGYNAWARRRQASGYMNE